MVSKLELGIEISVEATVDKALKLAELKKKLNKVIEDYFESENDVYEYDIWNFELTKDYEKVEVD